jgi:hypothetical protein
MNIKKYNKFKYCFALCLIMLTFVNCERDLSDDATLSEFSRVGEIFTDVPVGLTDQFFISFNPAEGANVNGFGTDNQVAYKGTTSIRIDVPSPSDPDGGFIGGIFRDRGAGRNLTGYNALTFWVKGSTTATVGLFGFGTDFIEDKYAVGLSNVQLSTDWKKVIIPIPDSSKLTQEQGMFIFSAGTQSTNGLGYTFWIDELRFEKLGTISNGVASIQFGQNSSVTTFASQRTLVSGAIATFGLPTGINQSVSIAPSYLEFTSSNPSVATVDASGVITSISTGTTVVTAKFNGVNANGSLTVNCAGTFTHAPIPTRPQTNVISLFSDHYENVPVNYFNGYWQPWQTTVSNDFSVNGDNILNYTIFNFVGIEYSSPTIDATSMTGIHLDVFIPGSIAPGRQLRVLVVDFGADGVFGGGDDTRHSTTFTAPFLASQTWKSIEIPFAAMPNLLSRSHLAQLILEGGDGSLLYVDNIFYYN